MAASTLIRFDTTAPTLTLGQAVRLGGDLRIPFIADEIATVNAAASSPGIGLLTAVVDPDEIIVTNIPSDAAAVELVISAYDDVNNESITEQSIAVVTLDYEFPLILIIESTEERSLIVQDNSHILIVEDDSRIVIVEDDGRLLQIDEGILRSLIVDPTILRSLNISETQLRSLIISEDMRNLIIEGE